jgi:general stress protein 26
MSKRIIEKIRLFLRDHARRHAAAVFVTAGPSGQPHATWMGTVASPRLDRILTMTSPTSRKVLNLLRNPQVEWMLSDESMERILYLRGQARVLEKPEEVEAAWATLTDKSRAWFFRFRDEVGMQFLILETVVEEIEYREPPEDRAEIVSVADLGDSLKEDPLLSTGMREISR